MKLEVGRQRIYRGFFITKKKKIVMSNILIEDLMIGNTVSHCDYTAETFKVIELSNEIVNTSGGKNGTWVNNIDGIIGVNVDGTDFNLLTSKNIKCNIYRQSENFIIINFGYISVTLKYKHEVENLLRVLKLC
jgi:hypothetical protein